MIKPYNTQNKITEYNSMFNTLPVNYNSHQDLEHMIHIYDTAIILQMEFLVEPLETNGLTEAILDYQNKEYFRIHQYESVEK